MNIPRTSEAESFNPEPTARSGTIEIPFYKKLAVAAENAGDEQLFRHVIATGSVEHDRRVCDDLELQARQIARVWPLSGAVSKTSPGCARPRRRLGVKRFVSTTDGSEH